jgi:hypothetical protein
LFSHELAIVDHVGDLTVWRVGDRLAAEAKHFVAFSFEKDKAKTARLRVWRRGRRVFGHWGFG